MTKVLYAVLGLISVAANALTPSVFAQTVPATAPAVVAPGAALPVPTQPAATAAADPSTPKGALKALARALDAGDRAAVLERFATDDEVQRRWAEATAILRRSAVAKFGAAGSRSLGVDVSAGPEAAARIDAAETVTEGDKAMLRSPQEEGPPLVVVRKGGQWRVPVSEFSKDVEPADLDRVAKSLTDEARLLRELATEVETGKYKSAADARQALDQRIMQSAMPRQPPPAHGAATKP